MKKFLEEFKAFALRGNVMDMAVGVLIGGAFSGIVTSLTDNFIQPIIKLVMTGKVYTLEEISGYASDAGTILQDRGTHDRGMPGESGVCGRKGGGAWIPSYVSGKSSGCPCG